MNQGNSGGLFQGGNQKFEGNNDNRRSYDMMNQNNQVCCEFNAFFIYFQKKLVQK